MLRQQKEDITGVCVYHLVKEESQSVSPVDYLDYVLRMALVRCASDIHIEPAAYYTRIRMRIAGTLIEYDLMPLSFAQALLIRLKVLAHMDSVQQTTAQDGALALEYDGKQYNTRISTFPSLYGQKAVIRLLDHGQEMHNLENLGLHASITTQLRTIAQQQTGLFLVTGPTGSGKTTTLYALIRSIDYHHRNIVTLEDPIEHRITGVTQTQMRSAVGLSFATALRSVLRQDPDVAMIGEIRDEQTVHITLEAALTGHLVFSTLHTARACQAIVRLIELGGQAHVIASSVTGVLAQRLVPLLCRSCKQHSTLTQQEQAWLRAKGSTLFQPWYAQGCQSCRYTGYTGRRVISELLIIDQEVAQAITPDCRAQALQSIACNGGMQTLDMQAIALACAGDVSLVDVIALGV